MAIKPGKYNPLKPDIELFDYQSKKRYGLKLEGSGALQVGTISQDDSVHIRSAGKRIGDFDEQRSWKGGRGIEKLDSNPDGFWDSKDAWTLADGHAHQTLLWQPAKGLRDCIFDLPSKTKSLTWKPLLGTSRYLSNSWTFNPAFTVDYMRMWIRRVGTPGTLTFNIHTDNSGNPGTVGQTGSVTVTDITDWVSVFQKLFVGGLPTLAAKYHVSVSATAADNKQNHWEIGGYSGGTTGKMSSDGSTWNLASFDAFYYVADSDGTGRTYFPFFLDDALYVVSRKDGGTASQLFINGDRGKATSTSANSLTDSSKAWTTNQWADARVKIIRGTGRGQSRRILSNTGTVLTLETTAWALTPDTTSEYIIYSTDTFKEISTTGLGVVTSQPLVVNQIVYFPQGNGTNIRRMVWNATTHSFADDGSNRASFLVKSSDANGTKIWNVCNSTTAWLGALISYATAVAGGASPTNLTFSATKAVGDTTGIATGLLEKEGTVYIFKEDGLWTDNNTNAIVRLQNGIDKTPSALNGVASIAHQQFVFYSWLHSAIRIYGSSHDDVGQDWSSKGLPDSREGNFSSFDSYTSLLIGAIDAGTGTSSVLGFDGLGWHELMRAYDANKRIRMVKVQPCQDTRNRLWIDVGGDLVYQELPLMKGSPRLDTGCRYMHEAVIESSTIDMGTASGLAKFIKELTVYSQNLGNGNEIYVDYQVDDAVHTTSWTRATVLYQSPESVAFLGLSNIRAFAYRLRICSSNNTAPVDILGVIPNGYARSPYKMVWTLRCRADNITSRGRIVKPDMLMRWLLDNARFPGKIEMKSQYELAHNFNVIIHPPRMFPYKPAQNGQAEESIFTIVLEEC